MKHHEKARERVDTVSPENTLCHDELYERFLATLDQFSPITTAVFVLNRYGDLSYAQIAKHFSIGVSAVEKHMMETLEKMKIPVQEP